MGSYVPLDWPQPDRVWLGRIKPCVSAFMGDQFKPEQRHLLPKAYAAFYFAINLGSTSRFLSCRGFERTWVTDGHLAYGHCDGDSNIRLLGGHSRYTRAAGLANQIGRVFPRVVGGVEQST
jgi:hypothetical protein